jgi:hypothetical protein
VVLGVGVGVAVGEAEVVVGSGLGLGLVLAEVALVGDELGVVDELESETCDGDGDAVSEAAGVLGADAGLLLVDVLPEADVLGATGDEEMLAAAAALLDFLGVAAVSAAFLGREVHFVLAV